MASITLKGKTYQISIEGFLEDFTQWDEAFAEGMASRCGIDGDLTSHHWDVINFIRKAFKLTGRCPLIYETCRAFGLNLQGLKKLFPSGYLRGACKLAGITYREGYFGYAPLPESQEKADAIPNDKTYVVDTRGFLINPFSWDEKFALNKAIELKMPDKLTEKHWKIIEFMRNYFRQNREVPTVYQTCEGTEIDIKELEQLFPDGYHRGAVKIAGLRVR